MQKTVRINLQARKNLLKKSHKDQIAAAKQEWNQYHQQKNTIDKKARQYVKEERANRREDWILGPLAPNRNVGQGKGTFGTIDVDLIQSPTIPKQVKGDPKFPGYDAVNYEKKKGLAFRGDTIVGNVVAGDRVVVVHGPERIRGKIGHVSSVDYDREELRIENINLVSLHRLSSREKKASILIHPPHRPISRSLQQHRSLQQANTTPIPPSTTPWRCPYL